MPLGSGDGTVRLWDVDSGKLLDTCIVSQEQEEVGEEAQGDSVIGAEEEGGEEAAECREGDGEEAVDGGEGGEEDEGEEHDGEGEEGGFEDDRVATGPKIAPVTCIASSKDG